MTHELMEALGREEELDPELAACFIDTPLLGGFIKHPLVNSLYAPPMNAYFNRQLRLKRKEVDKAFADKDWTLYILLHERPWRFEALQRIARLVDDRSYWELVSSVWIDSENIREHQDEWDELFRSPRPCHKYMMNDEELEDLAALPAVIPVYQGHTEERDDGWSWTTQYETAVWFAKRFRNLEDAEEAQVTAATVRREDVLAYFTGRGEAEILVDPELVVELYVEVVDGP